MKIGDVVSVKGQDVKMTVFYIDEDYISVHCMWFDKRDQLQEGEFDINILDVIEKN